MIKYNYPSNYVFSSSIIFILTYSFFYFDIFHFDDSSYSNNFSIFFNSFAMMIKVLPILKLVKFLLFDLKSFLRPHQ